MKVTLLLLFAGLLLLSVPIAAVLSVLTVVPSFFRTFPVGVSYAVRSMVGGSDSFLLLAIPMFILSGVIMTHGKIAERIFKFITYFLGSSRTGLPNAMILTCLFYGAISGSAPATVAAVGSMLLPILKKLDYPEEESTALLAVAGGLGVVIPPSIPFLLYGNATGTGIAALFRAGIVPGVMIAVLLMLVARHAFKDVPDAARKQYVEELRAEKFTHLFKDGFFALLSPVIVLGSIYSGLASPTESAVISVFYALIISLFFYRSFGVRDIPKILMEAIRIYAPILFLLAAALAFSRTLTIMGIPESVANFFETRQSSYFATIVLIQIFLLFVGMIMDTSAAILVLAPLLLPIVERFGIHPVHFGVMMILNLAIGFVTPPVGVNLFVAESLTRIPIQKIAKSALPYIGAFMIALILVILFPILSVAR